MIGRIALLSLAIVTAIPTPARGQCRLCDAPTTSRAEESGKGEVRLEVETSLNFEPRQGRLGSSGDQFDLDLAYLEWVPFKTADVHVFARRRFAAHPQLPQLLNCVGLRRAVLLAFDSSVLPTYRATMIN